MFLKRTISCLARKLCLFIFRFLRLRKTIVFECESDFDDNPRAVYDYILSSNKYAFKKLVWIVKNPEICKEYYNAKKTIFISRKTSGTLSYLIKEYYLRTSKYFVFSHPYWFKKYRKNQIVVHVSHGAPIKNVDQLSIPDSSVYDYLLCTGVDAAESLKKFWNCPEEKLVFMGYPRNDYLFETSYNQDLVKSFFDYADDEKIIIVMPTYKQSNRVNDSNLNDTFSLGFISNVEELKELNVFLKKSKIHLAIKIHPLQKITSLEMKDCSNIHYLTNNDFFDKKIPLYSFVGRCDALITDISSIFADFVLLNRPIGFLMKNIIEYKRGFIFENYMDYLCGDKIYNKAEFEQFCINLLKGEDKYTAQRQMVRNFFQSEDKGNNCEKFVDWLLSLNKK